MIFVQIASYRDPDLLPTIVDCLAKARYKGDLRFGICTQTNEADRSLSPFATNRNFRIDKVPWHRSEGLCWARARIQDLYEGEEYTLQLDSHHRFATDWDVKMLEQLEQTGSSKPILTTYANSFDLNTLERSGPEPWKMVADKFTSHGTIMFKPQVITEWRDLSKPIRARFVSGHFFFTVGKHCEDYAYDPNLYFAGDEISLSIRSFTMGYDIFHPHRPLIWHEYTRGGRTKHWDDHVEGNRNMIGRTWSERDADSKRRLRQLLRMEDGAVSFGRFGLGSERSHEDYERYAGIDFRRKLLHVDTVKGLEPPCQYVDEDHWNDGLSKTYSLELSWEKHDLGNCSDYHFIFIGVEDNSGKLLYRYDAPAHSPEATLLATTKRVEFTSATLPAKYIIWPVSRSKGWLEKKCFPL